MQLVEYRHIKNKKAKRLNLLKGSKPRNPSQTNGAANIQINLDTAIPNLRNVAQKYIGIVNPYGFLTDLRKALGIPNSSGVSKYGKVTIPKDDGSVLQASLRVTNHQANADKYVEHNTNYEYNLSIVVRRKQGKNTFIPNDNVKLDEFVYYGNNLAKVENPLTQIVNSIIGFLQNGTYKDTTGVAFINQSPQQQEDSNNNQTNENKTMKQKQVIKLNENQLRRIVSESVKKVIYEHEYYGKSTAYWSKLEYLEGLVHQLAVLDANLQDVEFDGDINKIKHAVDVIITELGPICDKAHWWRGMSGSGVEGRTGASFNGSSWN